MLKKLIAGAFAFSLLFVAACGETEYDDDDMEERDDDDDEGWGDDD